ncbi:hypothetical protein T484DRAFT_1658102, partial [Baffinella frigidus]
MNARHSSHASSTSSRDASMERASTMTRDMARVTSHASQESTGGAGGSGGAGGVARRPSDASPSSSLMSSTAASRAASSSFVSSGRPGSSSVVRLLSHTSHASHISSSERDSPSPSITPAGSASSGGARMTASRAASSPLVSRAAGSTGPPLPTLPSYPPAVGAIVRAAPPRAAASSYVPPACPPRRAPSGPSSERPSSSGIEGASLRRGESSPVARPRTAMLGSRFERLPRESTTDGAGSPSEIQMLTTIPTACNL